jgi:hypothetical protein
MANPAVAKGDEVYDRHVNEDDDGDLKNMQVVNEVTHQVTCTRE